MPIMINNNLPAASTLTSENIFWMEKDEDNYRNAAFAPAFEHAAADGDNPADRRFSQVEKYLGRAYAGVLQDL